MKFHHIGIATVDIEKTLNKIKKYFEVVEVSEIVYDPKQEANLCMITLNDGIKIELINGKVVQNIYHTCYSVEDIEKTIKKLTEEDEAFLVSEPKQAVLFNNKKVAFLMWDLGLIELLEEGGK